jgi:hypothetical protein
MPSLRCPRCGSNAPVFLATPDRLRCPSCSFDGAPDAESAVRLRGAAEILSATAAKERQLGDRQRRALVSAGRAVGCVAPLLAIVLLLLLVLAVMAVVDVGKPREEGTPRAVFAIVEVSVFVASAAAAGLGLRTVRRSRRRLRDACAAVPSAFPGEPATCHCCGGPLVAGDGSFARCGYCQADNLLEQDVMQRAAAHRASSTSDLVEQVQTETRSVALASASTLGRVMLVTVVTFLAIPFAAGFIITGIHYAFPLEVDAARTYAFVPTAGSSCVVRAATAPAGTPTFPATALIGRTMRSPAGRVGRVARVYRSLLHIDNVVWIVGPDGSSRGVEVAGLCAVDTPPAPLGS